MSHFYGPWKRTHWLLVRIGFPALYRSRYASPMIGGGWDGFEFAALPLNAEGGDK